MNVDREAIVWKHTDNLLLNCQRVCFNTIVDIVINFSTKGSVSCRYELSTNIMRRAIGDVISSQISI